MRKYNLIFKLILHLFLNYRKSMNLLSNNGSKTSNSDNTVKEKMLNEQIENLRSIHQLSCVVFDKVTMILKRILSFKIEHQEIERTEVQVKNHFIEDLCLLQEGLVNLIQVLDSDHELYICSVIFRDSNKNIQGVFFKEMMKSYQLFKEQLNTVIHRLEQDIQLLENNGFHIYSQTTKPNNVIQGLKRTNLEKYLISLAQIQNICERMKKKMSKNQPIEKNQIKFVPKNNHFRIQEYLKILKQIFLKEHQHRDLLVEEIQKLKVKLSNQNKKEKMIRESIKKNKKIIKQLEIRTRLSDQDPFLQKSQLKAYLKNLKGQINSKYLETPLLYKNSNSRSKSCSPIITRPFALYLNKKNDFTDNQIQKSVIVGSDFLQESLQI